MLSILRYVAKTWTLLNADSTAFKAFHMKCQRQLLQIKWHQFIWNDEITESTGLPSISESVSCRCNSLRSYCHVARGLRAHKALLDCHVNLSLGRPPSSQWSRHLGRFHNRWVDQIQQDNNLQPADLWRHAVSHGHCAAMLRSLIG